MKKILTVLCLIVCVMAFSAGTMLLSAQAAQEPFNLALSADSLETNTNIAEGAVAYEDDGIHISGWGNSLSNGTAGVYYKEKVSVGETVSVKMNGYAKDGTNGRFVMQLGFTQTYKNASLYPWATTGNMGKIINMEFKPNWLELTLKSNATYDSQVIATGNSEKNGTLPGDYNVLDKQEHTFTVIKNDTETGISLTISVDGQAYVENFAIDGADVQGDYYFSVGMQAWGDVTLSDEEYLTISSLTISNVFEGIEPEKPLPAVPEEDTESEDVSKNSDLFAGSLRAESDSLLVDENGIMLKNYAYEKAAAAFLEKKVAADSTVTFKFKANGELSEAQKADPENFPADTTSRFGIALTKSETLYNTSFDYWHQTGAVGKEILIEFSQSGWISVNTFTLGKYSIQMDPSEMITIADGKGNGPFDAGTLLMDGEEHTVVITTADTETGMKLSIVIDGQWYVYEAEIEGEEYQGGWYLSTGIYFNFLAKGKSDDSQYLHVTELRVSEYAPEPVYEIERNYGFRAEDVYYTGETIRLNLSNAFFYEGDSTLSYKVVNNETNEAIGEVSNGQWVYEATKEEFFKIKITASTNDGQEEFNVVDINIEQDDTGSSSGDTGGKPDSNEETGCNSSLTAFGSVSIFLLAIASVAVIKKKN